MRKLIIALMMLAICVNLASGALAAEAKLDIPDVAVQPGQTVYVALVLTDSVVGDSMGVTYSYDKEILQALPNSSTWGSAGMLANFSREDSGVWAVDGAKDLKGTVCVLAFRVKSSVTLTETTVSATVTVKNDAESVGTFSATGRLYAVCDHTYGQWQSEGNQLHAHACTKCGEKQSQSHIWDEGVITDHPTDEMKDLQTFTCTVCGATKETETPDRDHSAAPIEPTERPTMPELEYETRPPETEPTPTAPTIQYPQHTELVTVPTAPAPTEETGPNNPGGNKDNMITQNPNGNQNNSGNQNHSGNQSNTGNQNHSGNQSNTGNQNHSGNQSNTGNQNHSGSQNNTGNQSNAGNNTGTNQTTGNDSYEGHDHSSEGNNQQIVAVTIPKGVEVPENTEPGQEIFGETVASTEPIHVHVHEPVSPEQTGISLAALGAAVAMVAAAAVLTVILIKRVKRK